MTDELLIMALDGDGVDLTDLLQSGRHLVFDVAHERLDRGKAQIAGGDTIATLALDVAKKVKDQRRVQLFDKKLRRSCPDALSREGKQEPEAVGIGFTAMRAIAPLSGHVVAQEAGDQRSKEGHMGSKPKGGAKRAFNIPLSREMILCLIRAIRFGREMHPAEATEWVFPAD